MTKKNSGLTFIELLVVTGFLGIMTTVILTNNVSVSLKKGRDAQRKTDLKKLARVLEEYYNDKGHYPVPYPVGEIDDIPWGDPFPPYLNALPKDPLSPKQNYYYEGDPGYQRYYALYAKLENTKDTDIQRVGCQEGCGPQGEYNYVVHSPNIVMLAGQVSQEYEFGGGGEMEGGGPGSPTRTPTPTVVGAPTATPTPLPPTPTPYPGTCAHAEICLGMCGNPTPRPEGIGEECINELCCYSLEYGYWQCLEPINPCP